MRKRLAKLLTKLAAWLDPPPPPPRACWNCGRKAFTYCTECCQVGGIAVALLCGDRVCRTIHDDRWHGPTFVKVMQGGPHHA